MGQTSSGDSKSRSLVSIVVAALFSLAVCIVISPVGASDNRAVANADAAECAQWSLDNTTWQFAQTNGFVAVMSFSQVGTKVTGTLTMTQTEMLNSKYSSDVAPFTGTLDGDQLVIEVTFKGGPNGGTGLYKATVSAVDAISDGNAGKNTTPFVSQVDWSASDGNATCAQATSITTTTLSNTQAEKALLSALAGAELPEITAALAKDPNAESNGSQLAREFATDLNVSLFRAQYPLFILAGARNADGTPIFPSIANTAMLPVLMNMAHHASSLEADAQSYQTALYRLLYLLAGLDLSQTKASA